ncbi:hypothetical protein [Candidatus Leptofilum sp.]|uniref:hypothetical protein n=1 Tax=Candidatus Leptofilum sp. TaxID=3241576 RepID=UPI003B5C4594
MFLFIFGAIIGFLLAIFPIIIKYKDVDKYSPEEFVEAYPEVAWVNRFLGNVTLIWIIFYAFAGLLLLSQIFTDPVSRFTLTFWLAGGIGLIDGVFEIITFISPERIVNMSRTGRNRLLRLSVGDNVRFYGSIRTALVLLIGLIVPRIIQLTTN